MEKRHYSGCMICQSELVYSETQKVIKCEYCGEEKPTQTVCQNGHFVCNECHVMTAMKFIEKTLLSSSETDLIELFIKIRSHPEIPLHGPEFHSIIPGVVTTVYRNSGGDISDNRIKTSILRGQEVKGGACGFHGACGAALGAANAVGAIILSNPLKPAERRITMQVSSVLLGALSEIEAPRCCQRDCYIVLKTLSGISKDILGKHLKAEKELICTQYQLNKECILSQCPLFKKV